MKSKSREITDPNEIAFRADESCFKPDTWVAYHDGKLVGHSIRKQRLLRSLDTRNVRPAMVTQVGDNSIIDIPTPLEVG